LARISSFCRPHRPILVVIATIVLEEVEGEPDREEEERDAPGKDEEIEALASNARHRILRPVDVGVAPNEHVFSRSMVIYVVRLRILLQICHPIYCYEKRLATVEDEDERSSDIRQTHGCRRCN